MNKFSFETIENFDEHIDKSIPNYNVLFDSILRISEFFIQDYTNVYDVGCSTGKLIKELERSYKNTKFIGLDNSEHLTPNIVTENVDFVIQDLNKSYEFRNACIVYSIFTLQFLKREARAKILKDIYDGLNPGSAFIFCEKTYTRNAQYQDIFTFSYYDYKKHSFSEKEILDKERDLRKILKPNTTQENYDMLFEAGFDGKKVEIFYKYFQFEGLICIK